MGGGWIEKKDADGNLIQRVREEDAKLFYRRTRFERGYCEVWTDDFDRMYEIIYHHATCPLLGMRLIPRLMRLSEFDTGEIVVDQSGIAKDLAVSRQELNRTLNEFIEFGILEFIGKRSRHNVYRLPERIVWKGRPEKRMKLINGAVLRKTPTETSASGT